MRVKLPKEKTWYLEYANQCALDLKKRDANLSPFGMYDIGWNDCLKEVKKLNRKVRNK